MPRTKIDYSKCVIYQICCLDPEIEDVYIGHTTNLVNRRRDHKKNCNNEKSEKYNLKVYHFIRENGGWDNWRVELIEKYPCEDFSEACRREGYWIREKKSNLNCVVAGRTRKEHYQQNREKLNDIHKEYYQRNRKKLIEKKKEYHQQNREKINEYQKEYRQQNREKINEKSKEYHQQNREKINEKSKEYRQQNREKINEKKKEYHQQNREKINEKKKEYRQQNREKINEKKKEKVTCECGSEVNRSCLARHLKTKKHQSYISNNS